MLLGGPSRRRFSPRSNDYYSTLGLSDRGRRPRLKQSILMRGFICTPHAAYCCKTRKESETRDLRKKISRLFPQYDRRFFAASISILEFATALTRRFTVRSDVRDFPDRDRSMKNLIPTFQSNELDVGNRLFSLIKREMSYINNN